MITEGKPLDPLEWKCPCCKSSIIEGEESHYQNSLDHISNPNGNPPSRITYICSESTCHTRKKDMFWDEYGDLYVGGWSGDEHFENKNSAPFGSYSRKSNVEIYRKNLKKGIYLHPIFTFFIWKPYIEFKYKADYNGKITKRYYSLEFFKKDNGVYCLRVNLWWSSWKYLIKSFRRDMKAGNYEDAFSIGFNDNFAYTTFHWFLRKLYPNTYKRYANKLGRKLYTLSESDIRKMKIKELLK